MYKHNYLFEFETKSERYHALVNLLNNDGIEYEEFDLETSVIIQFETNDSELAMLIELSHQKLRSW